jgi:hypothetical protein
MRKRIVILPLALTLVLGACVQERPSVKTADGTLSYTKKKSGAAVLSGGAGYHGAYLQETPNKPKPEKKPQPVVKAAPGKLALPAGYALLPGDAELWPTLTREQQERALLFLKDGSTIRASLRTD